MLSDKEQDIMMWVVWGYTSQEIADHFEMSKRTVEHIRARVQDKLNCSTPAQTAVRFVRWHQETWEGNLLMEL